MAISSWREIVHDSVPDKHVVQIYRDSSFLHKVVASWCEAGLKEGGAALLVCTPANAEGVGTALRRLGMDPTSPEIAARLRIMDADELLARFLVDGMPDAQAFKRAVAPVLAETWEASLDRSMDVRVWGEMVNLLWLRGNTAAAANLERLWNGVLATSPARLLCSYAVDNFAARTHDGVLRAICEGHTQLIPEDDYSLFEFAIERALGEVFGAEEAGEIRQLFSTRRTLPIGMPAAQAVLVAMHELHPGLGRRVAEAARTHLESLGRAE